MFRILSCCLLALASAAACAQTPTIYSCTTPDGRHLTSDRPILDCTSHDQRVLNADGSQRGVLPAYLSPEERANKEAEQRRLEAEKVKQQEAVRRDRNLMQRFPTEAAHNAARASALDDANKSMHVSEMRIKDLGAERRPLDDEAEFYKGKPLPGKLKQAIDANDAAVEAQKQLIENQKAEIVRINKRYDAELEHLKKLWAGAAPGSLPSSGSEP